MNVSGGNGGLGRGWFHPTERLGNRPAGETFRNQMSFIR